MWDIGQIIKQNNDAALEYMMAGKHAEEVEEARPEAFSLAILAEKMKSGPPSLSGLMNYLASQPDIDKFHAIVRDFLPEYEREIIGAPLVQRSYKFAYRFSKKYFPLPSGVYRTSVGRLAEYLPICISGLAYDTYHDLAMRPGYLMLLSLVVYPFEGDERDFEDDAVPFRLQDLSSKEKYEPSGSDCCWLRNLVASLTIGGEWKAPMGFRMVKTAESTIELRDALNTPEVKETIRRTLIIAREEMITAKAIEGRSSKEKEMSGPRLALIDKVQGIVGAKVAQLIPNDGWLPEDIHRMTDNGRFDGCGNFADWALGKTGCIMLDYSYDNCTYIEGCGDPMFHWSRYNVDRLTREWPKVLDIRGKIDHMVEWLEIDPPNNFRDLIRFMRESWKMSKIKRKKADPAYFERGFIELDQIEEGEEDEDENGTEEDRNERILDRNVAQL